jgi:hypothetical protein
MPHCRHCRRERDPLSALELCEPCQKRRQVRTLYEKRRPGWTPAWEAHLRHLEERARRKLPLFPRDYRPPADGGDPRVEARWRERLRKRRAWLWTAWRRRLRKWLAENDPGSTGPGGSGVA